MSRVGKLPVATAGAQVEIAGQLIKIKGPKGELSFDLPKEVNVEFANDELVFKPVDDSREARSLWGTARSRVNNMVQGVKEGYKIELELQGTGFRAKANGKILDLFLGYSHDIKFALPQEINVTTPSATEIVVEGADKQLVGQIAAEIRSFRKPEPYKGKGVRRKGEYVRRKEGKKK